MKRKTAIIFIVLVLTAISALLVLSFFLFLPKKQVIEEKKINYNDKNVVVYGLKAGQEIKLPIKVAGKARVFENTVSFEITEQGTNRLLYQGWTQSNAQDMGLFGDFEKEIDNLFFIPKKENVILKIFWSSPKDGSSLDVVSIPLKIINLEETSKVKLFFNNNNLDPEFSCNKVFPIERIIAKTQAPARKALELLLQGTSSLDVDEGFFTSINPDVKIQSLVIENNTAKVDFDEQIEFQVGGSCRVSAIRSQITQTLKQFPSVKEVIISVNGRTEDILQP